VGSAGQGPKTAGIGADPSQSILAAEVARTTHVEASRIAAITGTAVTGITVARAVRIAVARAVGIAVVAAFVGATVELEANFGQVKGL
jgi:hypothetical protein